MDWGEVVVCIFCIPPCYVKTFDTIELSLLYPKYIEMNAQLLTAHNIIQETEQSLLAELSGKHEKN